MPTAVKSKAKEVTKVAKDQKVENWSAVPARYVENASQVVSVSSENIYQVNASVPGPDIESALASGALLEGWMVLNYEKIAQGIGIPFMMMGLVFWA